MEAEAVKQELDYQYRKEKNKLYGLWLFLKWNFFDSIAGVILGIKNLTITLRNIRSFVMISLVVLAAYNIYAADFWGAGILIMGLLFLFYRRVYIGGWHIHLERTYGNLNNYLKHQWEEKRD